MGSDFNFLTLGTNHWMMSLADCHIINQSIPIQHRTLCSHLKKSNDMTKICHIVKGQSSIWFINPYFTGQVCMPTRNQGGGSTHIFGWTGLCCSNGSLFYKKSLNMGPVFSTKKSLNMGQRFWLSPNFRVFAWLKPRKLWNFCKMGLFFKKNP